MSDKVLSENQKIIVAKRISSAIINKVNQHPADLTRAALILYDLNKLGYNVLDLTIGEILEKSDSRYSESVRETLEEMANSYSYLVNGMNEYQYAKWRITENDLK